MLETRDQTCNIQTRTMCDYENIFPHYMVKSVIEVFFLFHESKRGATNSFFAACTLQLWQQF